MCRAAAASRPKSVSDDEASDSDKDIEDEVEEPARKIVSLNNCCSEWLMPRRRILPICAVKRI